MGAGVVGVEVGVGLNLMAVVVSVTRLLLVAVAVPVFVPVVVAFVAVVSVAVVMRAVRVGAGVRSARGRGGDALRRGLHFGHFDAGRLHGRRHVARRTFETLVERGHRIYLLQSGRRSDGALVLDEQCGMG